MNELFGFIKELAQTLWPFRIIEQYERGGYYLFGRWRKEVGPGVYVVVPYFGNVRSTNTAWAIVGTGRQDITLMDGTMLSFMALATCRVANVYTAQNEIDDHRTSMQELMGSFLATRLAEEPAERLTPEKRGRLFTTLKNQLAEEAKAIGIEVRTIRFSSFVTRVKTIRLMTDMMSAAPW